MKKFTSKPLELPAEMEGVSRADLVFYGVDHSGPSYEARVFIENPDASPNTPLEPEEGYVGSYTVFGHAGCFGDEGHCHPEQRFSDEFDRRPPHPLAPFTRQLTVTDALKQVKRKKVRVTVVPVVREVKGVAPPDIEPAERVRLLAYEG